MPLPSLGALPRGQGPQGAALCPANGGSLISLDCWLLFSSALEAAGPLSSHSTTGWQKPKPKPELRSRVDHRDPGQGGPQPHSNHQSHSRRRHHLSTTTTTHFCNDTQDLSSGWLPMAHSPWSDGFAVAQERLARGGPCERRDCISATSKPSWAHPDPGTFVWGRAPRAHKLEVWLEPPGTELARSRLPV